MDYKFSNLKLGNSYSYPAPPKVPLLEVRPELDVGHGLKYLSKVC